MDTKDEKEDIQPLFSHVADADTGTIGPVEFSRTMTHQILGRDLTNEISREDVALSIGQKMFVHTQVAGIHVKMKQLQVQLQLMQLRRNTDKALRGCDWLCQCPWCDGPTRGLWGVACTRCGKRQNCIKDSWEAI